MAQFTPKKANKEVEEIKAIFLEGKAIKIDGRELIEVTDDKYNNVKYPSGYSAQCFWAAIRQLLAEGYIFKKCSCDGSGCCQYHAVSYWLVGE